MGNKGYISDWFDERKNKWGEDVGSQEKIIFSWKKRSSWKCCGTSRGYSYWVHRHHVTRNSLKFRFVFGRQFDSGLKAWALELYRPRYELSICQLSFHYVSFAKLFNLFECVSLTRKRWWWWYLLPNRAVLRIEIMCVKLIVQSLTHLYSCQLSGS